MRTRRDHRGWRSDAGGCAESLWTGTRPLQVESAIELCHRCAEITEDGPRALMPAAAEILKPLYPHQQEALAWMVNRENTNAMTPFWEPLL